MVADLDSFSDPARESFTPAERATIDCGKKGLWVQGNSPCLRVDGTSMPEMVVRGITFKRGDAGARSGAEKGLGGVIKISNGATVDCARALTFLVCKSSLACLCRSAVADVEIRDSRAVRGGAVHIDTLSVLWMRNSRFINNTASEAGGAM